MSNPVRRTSKQGRTAGAARSPASKLDQIAKALRKAKGASIQDLTKLTGWQAHSVRGAIAGALKKRGLNILSQRVGAKRVYRIAESV
jgi:hypothetical protein